MANKRKTITKEWLQTLGITDVTKDGKITYKGKIAKEYKATCKHKHGTDKSYPIISLYDSELYKEQLESGSTLKTGQRQLLVSRIVYAWFNGICPAEYDVDHIDNNPFNNNLSNLQLLTRKENLSRRLGRNSTTCHLTEEELMYFNDQKRSFTSEIIKWRSEIQKAKEDLKKIENDYHYYEQLCKSIEEYKLLKQVKDDYEKRIEEAAEKVARYTEEWHFWCGKFKAFKKEYLTRERTENK